MRDVSEDLSALALNTATLGHNLDGHGAGWPPEKNHRCMRHMLLDRGMMGDGVG